MVNIVKTDFDVPGEPFGNSAVIPVRYSKRWWFIGFSRYGKVIVVDIANKTAQAIDTGIGQTHGNRIVDANFKGTKFYVRLFAGDPDNNAVRLLEYEIDLSALSATANELWKIDTSVDSDMAGDAVKGTVVSNRFILHATANKPYIWYIDAKDGSIIYKFDTGLSTYNPRICASKAVVKPDDIYLLGGRHLSGDDFYAYKVYSKSYTAISNTAPGSDSPQPHIGNALVSEKLHLIPVSGCTVINTNPPIRWFDDDFNLLGSTDLSGVSGYSAPHPTGWHVIGRDSAGNIIMLISVLDNDFGNATKTKIMLLSIDPSTYEATSLYSSEYSEELMIAKSWYSDPRRFALVDKSNKKLYTLGAKRPDTTETAFLLEVDFSDVDINEWNLQTYYTAEEKIPTVLSLSVTPL